MRCNETGCQYIWGCHVWIAVVMIELVRECSVRYEMRVLRKFLRYWQCVFFVRCELRLKKLLRTALFCVTVQRVVIISYQRFWTTDWSHLVVWILTLMMGPTGCLKMLVTNYHNSLYNNPQKCRYHLCGGSLKSRLISAVHGAQPEWNSAWI